MKNKIIAAALLAAVAAPALAEISPYVAVRGGMSNISFGSSDEKVDVDGYGYNLAVGARYGADGFAMRGELEYSAGIFKEDKTESLADPDDSSTAHDVAKLNRDMSAGNILVNFYADFLTDYRLKPYVGFGLGRVSVKNDAHLWVSYYIGGDYANEYEDFSERASGMTYGLHVGGGFNFTDSLGGELGGRYFKVKLEDTDVSLWSAGFGLNYRF